MPKNLQLFQQKLEDFKIAIEQHLTAWMKDTSEIGVSPKT